MPISLLNAGFSAKFAALQDDKPDFAC